MRAINCDKNDWKTRTDFIRDALYFGLNQGSAGENDEIYHAVTDIVRCCQNVARQLQAPDDVQLRPMIEIIQVI